MEVFVIAVRKHGLLNVCHGKTEAYQERLGIILIIRHDKEPTTFARTGWFFILPAIGKTNSNQGVFITVQKGLRAYELESMAELRL